MNLVLKTLRIVRTIYILIFLKSSVGALMYKKAIKRLETESKAWRVVVVAIGSVAVRA